LLEEPSLVQHEDAGRGIAERLPDETGQFIAHGLLIPACTGEQALDPIRVWIAHRFGELPAVLARHRTDQGTQIAGAALAHLRPIEVGGEAGMHGEERLGEGVEVGGTHR
jgi:hypothetical protein